MTPAISSCLAEVSITFVSICGAAVAADPGEPRGVAAVAEHDEMRRASRSVPGSMVRPLVSTTVASGGIVISDAGPAWTILLPSIRIAA